MTEENNDKQNENEFDTAVKEAHDKLGIDIDYLREITLDEVYYLLNHCPFLQMVDVKLDLDNEANFEIIRSKTNWDIHSYGDALASSPGKFIFGGGYYVWGDDDDDGGSGGGPINPGQGTIFNQAIKTAQQMVEIAIEQNWTGIKIVDGHPLMMRAAWIKAAENGLYLTGFAPDAHDELVRDRVSLSETDYEVLRTEVRQNLG